uniref:Uncharacterized protein n=1 Tax=Anopheles coluzzii TaxID=1518534 RepID=A0A8W7P423_ANOCL
MRSLEIYGVVLSTWNPCGTARLIKSPLRKAVTLQGELSERERINEDDDDDCSRNVVWQKENSRTLGLQSAIAAAACGTILPKTVRPWHAERKTVPKTGSDESCMATLGELLMLLLLLLLLLLPGWSNASQGKNVERSDEKAPDKKASKKTHSTS